MDNHSNQVSIIGQGARDWLAACQQGAVLAHVSHATYLLTDAQQLVWLAVPAVPLHRRGLQVSPSLPRLSAGTNFTVKNQTIVFDSGITLDFYAALPWNAASIHPSSDLLESKLVPGRQESFCETFLAGKSPVGLGRVIPTVIQITNDQHVKPAIAQEENMLAIAWPVVERIARACLAHNFDAAFSQAETLIGLGEGLTPSGDDFLGGLLFCRHMLACFYPQLDYLQYPHLIERLEARRSRTNLISFTLLMDHALGHGIEPLGHFGSALLTNQPLEHAITAAANIIRLGHSTGWDLLSGFLVGMLLVG